MHEQKSLRPSIETQPKGKEAATPDEIEQMQRELHMSGRATALDETPAEFNLERRASWEEIRRQNLEKRFSSLTPELRAQFPLATQQATLKIHEHIQGKNNLENLSPEEAEVLEKLRALYKEAKRKDPKRPVEFQFQQAVDKMALENLTRKMAFRELDATNSAKNADEVRKIIGAPIVENSDSQPLENPTKELSAEQLEAYLKLPNVQKAYQKIMTQLHSGFISAGTIKNILYDMLITRSGYEIIKNNTSQYQAETAAYKSALESIQKNIESKKTFDYTVDPRFFGNPGWFHIITRPEAKGKIKELSRKRYATIDLINSRFVENIEKFAEKLREIAVANDDSIEIKFPESFISFAQHNDSIVIHYKRESSLAAINSALETYLKQEGITEGQRELGRIKSAVDPKDTSFSDHIAMAVGRWLDENYKKYPNDILAKGAIKNVIEIAQKPPVVKY